MKLRNRNIYQTEKMEGNNHVVESDSEWEEDQATPVGELEIENIESSQSEVDSQEKGEKQNEAKKENVNSNTEVTDFVRAIMGKLQESSEKSKQMQENLKAQIQESSENSKQLQENLKAQIQ